MGDSKASYFYIDKILDDFKFIESHTKGISYMDFAANDLLIYSRVARSLCKDHPRSPF